jgi:hypothetical protein
VPNVFPLLKHSTPLSQRQATRIRQIATYILNDLFVMELGQPGWQPIIHAASPCRMPSPQLRLAEVVPYRLTEISHHLGYGTGSNYVVRDDRLTLEAAVAMSNQLFSRPTALEEAAVYLNNLETSSPTLFKIIADGANEISAMLFPERDAKGRLWYRCVQCGKPWDRWNRARDCQNSDLKLRPYECRGECGNTSWFV